MRMDEKQKIWEGMMEKKGLRNAARAVIIEENRLLCTKNEDPLGIFYLLPGGGQRMGETLPETLRRECREEVGAQVFIGPLLYVREYIGAHHEFAEYDADVHQIEFFFSCTLHPESTLSSGTGPDSYQLGVEWLPLHARGEYRIYPKTIFSILSSHEGVYLGDIN